MRGQASPQSAMFSYVSLEERIPTSHPLRKLRLLVDSVLASMDDEFDAIYARVGGPSVPPGRLLQALLLQILFSIRSERLLVESLDYNLLYRWFVGLGIDDAIWDHSTFSQNRDRLFNEGLARIFFERVKALAQWGKLTSSEHFSVDGTLIEAWASHKSFKPKDGSGPPACAHEPRPDGDPQRPRRRCRYDTRQRHRRARSSAADDSPPVSARRDGRCRQGVRHARLRCRLPQGWRHAARCGQAHRLGTRWPHDTPRRLQELAQSAQAHRGSLRLAENRRRSAQDQADRSRETRRPGAAVLRNLQPGAHRQPHGLVGCQACVGRNPPVVRRKANTRHQKASNSGAKWSNLTSLASKTATRTEKPKRTPVSTCVFQRPVNVVKFGRLIDASGDAEAQRSTGPPPWHNHL